jgi:hypothetical protein
MYMGIFWHLNRLKMENITKYSVFEFLKLKGPNKNCYSEWTHLLEYQVL